MPPSCVFAGTVICRMWFKRQNFSLHAAAVFDVDEGISVGRENIAGADHVRAAKQNHAVAIGVRVGLVINDDGFTVEVQVFGGRSVFVDREARLRKSAVAREPSPSGG